MSGLPVLSESTECDTDLLQPVSSLNTSVSTRPLLADATLKRTVLPALSFISLTCGPSIRNIRFYIFFHPFSKSTDASNLSSKYTEEDEKDPEESDEEDLEDPNMSKDYKDLEKNVQSFRFDVVMKAGLDMARNKIEDAFYSNKLRLNGQKLIKKSKTVKVGDTLDLVLSENRDTNTVTLMRIVLRKVLAETTSTEKHKVALRRWKSLELPKEEQLSC
uniref:Mitochondrial transcription rescue factor 1 C-terminal domain-containing protein n=1 Tax=Periophthalmus magnuspinnatus TaxID=409849 RepID=A0A3B4BJ58_9GOBI